MRGALRLACCFVLLGCGSAQAGVLKDPIDRTQQTGLTFGDRSHWLQPWRAYLETPPATQLRDAIGINFNHIDAEEVEPTAKLLGRSGFRRARLEVGWDQMDHGDPTRLKRPGLLHLYLNAFKANGIRPLILLNANHGSPGPLRSFDVVLREPARAGDRRVRLDGASAAAVVPHRTGLDSKDPWRAADVMFTEVGADGWATLSRALPRHLAAGPHRASTLRFAPFGPPELATGAPNPAFEHTMQGWLAYAGAVAREAKAVLGSQAFDVEVWNELGFGSDFLFQERYYDTPREEGDGDVTEAILKRTVGYLREPGNGVPKIGIGNGFAAQDPWDSGVTSPPGLTAIDKHPYYGIKRFPDNAVLNGIAPLDAKGNPSYTESPAPGGGLIRRDHFIPRYDSFFPEYILTSIQTEHLIRDISPITTDLYGKPHGRSTRPQGGRAPTMWITEANMDATGADPPNARLTDGDVEHLQAKAALRYYTAFANKGVAAIHLYGVRGGNLALVRDSFFQRARASGGGYPGDDAGGETPTAVRRLSASLAGAASLKSTRPLSLRRISDSHNHKQFAGGGGSGHPPLYNRDVLGFFPFQVRRGQYVAAVYVMTRNLAQLYRPGAPASDRGRYDLPPEKYRLEVGGLRSDRVHASATDPLTGASVPVRSRPLGGGRIEVQLPVTDSPRMLRLVERAGPASRISLRARRKRLTRGSRQVFTGRVRSQRRSCAGRVALVLRRQTGTGKRRHWRRVRTVSASSARRAGRFSVSVARLRSGRYRARAKTRGKGCRTARSNTVRFSVR